MRSSQTGNAVLSERPPLSTTFYTAILIAAPDHQALQVQGMNNNGDVVGVKTDSSFVGCHAFLWSHGMISDVSLLCRETMTSAMMIDDDQQILGHTASCSHGGEAPILFKRKMRIDLRTLPGGKNLVSVDAIARDGRMLGMERGGKPILYSKGAWRDFILPSGRKISSTSGNLLMNSKGDVAGIFAEDGEPSAQRAEIGGKEYLVKCLPHAYSTVLVGLSDSGVVAGNSSQSPPGSNYWAPTLNGDAWSMLANGCGGAFVWTVRDGFRALPALTGCSLPTVNAISPAGDIAGTCQKMGRRRLTLWRHGVAEDISSLIPSLADENLVDVCAINDRGQMCVEVQEGMNRLTYLLSPPVKQPLPGHCAS